MNTAIIIYTGTLYFFPMLTMTITYKSISFVCKKIKECIASMRS